MKALLTQQSKESLGNTEVSRQPAKSGALKSCSPEFETESHHSDIHVPKLMLLSENGYNA